MEIKHNVREMFIRMSSKVQFMTVEDYSKQKNQKKRKIMILRFDIDCHPEFAYAIALMLKRLDIKATYYFMPNHPLYNIFSKQTENIMYELIYLGNEIGLHTDAQKVYELKQHIKLFSNLIEPVSYSMHKNNRTIINSDEVSLINADKYTYYSDSLDELDYDTIKVDRNGLLMHPCYLVKNSENIPEMLRKIQYQYYNQFF